LKHPPDRAINANPEPRLRRRTDRRQQRLVHDDALWHEGPDDRRSRKTQRHEGPRETRRDRPTPDSDRG
jgi:hypothetical protein